MAYIGILIRHVPDIIADPPVEREICEDDTHLYIGVPGGTYYTLDLETLQNVRNLQQLQLQFNDPQSINLVHPDVAEIKGQRLHLPTLATLQLSGNKLVIAGRSLDLDTMQAILNEPPTITSLTPDNITVEWGGQPGIVRVENYRTGEVYGAIEQSGQSLPLPGLPVGTEVIAYKVTSKAKTLHTKGTV